MAATFEEAKDQVARLVAHFRANSDHALYPRQIAATDRAIDRLVYEPYHSREDEIRVIERDEGGGRAKMRRTEG